MLSSNGGGTATPHSVVLRSRFAGRGRQRFELSERNRRFFAVRSRAGSVAAVRDVVGTELSVFELCLGTNVFGWTADERDSFAVLDAYRDAGGNFLDTADSYSSWVDGHEGGEAETVIGRWLASRGCRDELVIATKVGSLGGLDVANVERRIEDSLRRLGTDRVDLYYAHRDDPQTPLEETMAALDAVVKAGKARYIAASNYGPERLGEALAVSRRDARARFVAFSPHYNLLERGYESTLASICAREGLACCPYFGLAKGFLTGKYRPGSEAVESPRAEAARAYLERGGSAVLEALDEVAAAHRTTVAAVALAWLRAQPRVVAPIASARSAEQLEEILPGATLRLTAEEIERLSAVTTK
jgi:aryl-alcohol dehydrogenase-like predicted oxidoreductase